jgi:dolichol-phosphate mannosyltransferase
MNADAPLLCVVAPCFNEAESIAAFYNKLKPVLVALPDLRHRILFVDDGSSDSTLEQLKKLAGDDADVRVYSLSRNFGHQVAVSAGLDVARGDAVVMMDSDCQHPPSLIPEMVQQWRAGYDVVSAVRQSTADAGWFKRFSSDAFYLLINKLSETPIVPGVADYCLLSRRAHRALRAMPERHRFLRGMVSWIGFPRTFVSYEAPPRIAGKSKYVLARMINLALDAVFSFSSTPIKIASRFGLFLFAAGMLYLIYILASYFAAGGLVHGWASLISVVLILNGVQLIFVGLSGQYQARIFEQVKGRPLYFFKETPPRRRRKRSSPTRIESSEPPATPATVPANAASDNGPGR